jgi:hypothetical protein
MVASGLVVVSIAALHLARNCVPIQPSTKCTVGSITGGPQERSWRPWARPAMKRWSSAGMSLSSSPNTNHDGSDFHAGGPEASFSATSRTGRWPTAMRAVCSAGNGPYSRGPTW